jgi:hypothetical protein
MCVHGFLAPILFPSLPPMILSLHQHCLVYGFFLYCVQFAKLARDMKMPAGISGGGAHKGGGDKSSRGTTSSSGPAEDDKDDFAEGLC